MIYLKTYGNPSQAHHHHYDGEYATRIKVNLYNTIKGRL